ncbi:hypothetical protein GCM10010174_88530 [Kutzneria viridogrisea]|uniref:Uncharacterized protein n=1 Tax=Kutzneria viridogrisea TaxID=47990 RepID=A0ABR6BJH5_9PSEU|nr:hypothetical protein [Kutzneria viridogrisea]
MVYRNVAEAVEHLAASVPALAATARGGSEGFVILDGTLRGVLPERATDAARA